MLGLVSLGCNLVRGRAPPLAPPPPPLPPRAPPSGPWLAPLPPTPLPAPLAGRTFPLLVTDKKSHALLIPKTFPRFLPSLPGEIVCSRRRCWSSMAWCVFWTAPACRPDSPRQSPTWCGCSQAVSRGEACWGMFLSLQCPEWNSVFSEINKLFIKYKIITKFTKRCYVWLTRPS